MTVALLFRLIEYCLYEECYEAQQEGNTAADIHNQCKYFR